MGTKFYNILFFTVIIQVLNVISPTSGKALTRWNGTISLEDTEVSTPHSSSNLFQGRINLDVQPPVKKRLDARFNLQFNVTKSDEETLWDASPIGNLGVELRGESYSLNVKYNNSVHITSSAELVETELSRAAFIWSPQDLPTIVVDYSTTDTSSDRDDTQTDIFSFFSDYDYKWMNFRGGYTEHERFKGGQKTSTSDSYFFGTGGSYEILPRTILTGDFDFNHSSSDSLNGFQTTTEDKAFRASATSRPLDWFELSGNFNKNITDSESNRGPDTSTERRDMDLTARLYPIHSVQLWTTVGNRIFDYGERARDVDYTTIAASFRDDLQENIQIGLNLSRTVEDDPDQGDNTRDNFGFNSTMDLTPRISALFNLNISRNEIPGFISTATFDATGTLAERDTYDDEPAGFTFFDTDNNDLYTKNSSASGDWSDPVYIDPVTEQFLVSNTLQLNMVPTDKTSLVLSYTSNFNDDKIDLVERGNQTFNGSFSYRPNLRTSYSLTGTASLPETGSENYAGTLSMSYKFFRGHRMNLSYSSRFFAGREMDDFFSTNFRFLLRKRTNMDITYSTSKLFKKDEQTYFIKARLSKYF